LKQQQPSFEDVDTPELIEMARQDAMRHIRHYEEIDTAPAITTKKLKRQRKTRTT
jgi:hypothetical protein